TLHKAGVQVAHPKGGFYCFPNFDPLRAKLAKRRIGTSETLCERLLEETGVAMLPGTVFGRPATELSARIAFVDFDGAAALKAAEDLEPEALPDQAFLQAHCGPVVEAMSRLANWL
ncbi:MAG: aminotransferase class I/II-fold pyridoxal phosphate-dependent enzyme, partial [Gammaproteobacteria bacterium]